MALRTTLFLLTNLAVVVTIALLLALATAIGWLPPDLPLAPLLLGSFFWGVMGSWLSLQWSRQSAIAAMGVQLVDGSESEACRWLLDTVTQLSQKAGLPMPEVGIYASPEFNAFATGAAPEQALVAVSSGILEGMPSKELEAVLGHELSHVGNGDMVTMTLLQGVVNAFVLFLARLLSLLLPRGPQQDGRSRPPAPLLVQPLELLLGLAGSMITAWFSRHREYRADAGAAQLVDSEAMVSALERLAEVSGLVDPRDSPALANFKIAAGGGIQGLLASHPPLGERIRALRQASDAAREPID
ncbi:MAG: protease HtpX [Prochlorococcaceae cyanobacterium]